MAITATLGGTDRDQAARMVALFSVVVHSWLTGDFLEAARAHDELSRLGVTIRIRRRVQQASPNE